MSPWFYTNINLSDWLTDWLGGMLHSPHRSYFKGLSVVSWIFCGWKAGEGLYVFCYPPPSLRADKKSAVFFLGKAWGMSSSHALSWLPSVHTHSPEAPSGWGLHKLLWSSIKGCFQTAGTSGRRVIFDKASNPVRGSHQRTKKRITATNAYVNSFPVNTQTPQNLFPR